MEYLSRLLDCLKDNPDFNHHAACKRMNITHLSFADDLMIFTRADPISVSLVVDCLTVFGVCSGLLANLSKSHIFLASVSDEDRDAIIYATGFTEGCFPIKYLGIPLCGVNMRVADFESMFLAITNQFAKWNGSSLSYAGRLQLLKSVIQGVNSFWFSIFPINVTVLDKLDMLCRRFLWGGSIESRKRCSISWDTVSHPLNEGGLGIFQLAPWNKALLCRVLWDINNKKDSLWIRWLSDVYLKEADFWTYRVVKKDSGLVKAIAAIRDSLIVNDLGSAKALLASWNRKGQYSPAVAYDCFRGHRFTVWWHTLVWNKSLTPKHSFMMWMLLSGGLWTSDKGYFEDQSCILCKELPESASHLFFACSFSAAVWKDVKDWLGIRVTIPNVMNALNWMKRRCRGSSMVTTARKACLSVSLYWIWHARNKARFDNNFMKKDAVLKNIKTHIALIVQKAFPNQVFIP